MTVRELKAALADVPDDFAVVLSRDAEGNGYSPLAAMDVAEYRPDSTWSGEVSHPDDGPFTANAFVLWPTN